MGKLLVPYKSPPLTIPFNVAALLFLAGTAHMPRADVGTEPSLPSYSESSSSNITGREFFAGVIRGIGQVFLANEIVSGVLVLIGIAICSRISALAAVVGSAIGAATALATGAGSEAIEQGIYGFNASLTFTAMFMFYTPSFGAGIMGVLATIMTVFGQQALATFLQPYGLPFMTLPFCVIALPFVILQGTTTLVVPVPLASMTTPEDHLTRVRTLYNGFGFLSQAIESKSKLATSFSRKMSQKISDLSTALESGTSDDPEIGGAESQGKDEEVNETASQIFREITRNKKNRLNMPDFVEALRVSGLVDREGIHFATLVFLQLDTNGSKSIDLPGFTCLCTVSCALRSIRHHIARFLSFVDCDGTGFVSVEDIDGALLYLGEDRLSASDREGILRLTGAKSDDAEMEVIEFVNLLTVSEIRALVKEHRTNTPEGTTCRI
jgi:Ca2+-binding EF-hand superfamily protein